MHFLPRSLFIGWFVAASTTVLVAQTTQEIPSGGTNVVDPAAIANPEFWNGASDGAEVSLSVVAVDEPAFTQAVELEIVTPGVNAWSGQLRLNLDAPVATGDVALLHFWMRVPASLDESGTGSVLAMIEEDGGDFTRSVQQTVAAGPNWIPFYIPFAFAEAYATGGVQVKFGLGLGDPRTVQIGGVQVWNYGTSRSLEELPETSFSYLGRAQDAPWRSEAAARIEAHRKADFVLRLRTTAGDPLSGTVDLDLARHAFHFASVIDAATLMGTGADNQLYREKLLELFNASGTENDLKWVALAGDWGSGFNHARTSSALEWLRLRGFFIRGHVLVWPGTENLPAYINDRLAGTAAQRASVPQEVLNHIEETVTTYAPWIDEWDVLNEPYTNSTLMEAFEGDNPDLLAEWFQEARHAAGPEVGLYLNEYTILSGLAQDHVKREATKATLRKILDQGGPLTGFGMQGHFDESSLTPINRIHEVIEEFAAEFPSLRFRITEFDLATDDEQLQADYLRDFLTMVFAHPRVDGFQMWGFWAGRHWRPAGALFAEDWTPRLQLQAYEDLLATWRSSFQLATNSAGEVSGRGFKGDYEGVLQTAQGHYDFVLPVGSGSGDFELRLPPAGDIDGLLALPLPSAGHLAVAFATVMGEDYWIQLSDDGVNWRDESLPQPGSGRPQVIVFPVPSADTFWRVARSGS